MATWLGCENITRRQTKLRWVFLTVVVGAVSAGLAVYWLATIGLWIDELYTLHAVRLPFSEMLRERLARGHPPLYFIIQKGVYTGLASLGVPLDVQLRAFSFVCWVTAILSFTILNMRYLPLQLAAAASAITSVNTTALMQAANGRMYTLVLLAAVWWTHAWIALQELRNPVRWRLVMIASAVVGCGASPTFAVLLLIAALDALRSRREIRITLAALSAGLMLLLPGFILYVLTPHQLGPASKKPERLLMGLLTLASGVGAGKWPNTLAAQVLSALGYGLGALGLTGVLRRNYVRKLPPYVPIRLFLWLAAFTALNSLVSIIPVTRSLSVGTDRYLIAFVPLGAIVGAYGFLHVCKARPKPACTLIMLTAICSWLWILTSKPEENEKFSRAVQAFRRAYKPGEATIIAPKEIRDAVEILLPETMIVATLPAFCPRSDEVAAAIRHAEHSSSVWLFMYRAHCPVLSTRASERWGAPEVVYGSATKREPILLVARFRTHRE